MAEDPPGKDARLIHIGADGELKFVHNDDLRFLFELGPTTIRRASHVEPEGVNWVADLGPVGGPKLGPFATREEALREEVRYLHEHLHEV